MRVVEAIDQALGFGAGQQFVGVALDDLGQVGGEGGGGINDRVAGRDGLRLELGRDPFSGHVERGLTRVNARQRRRVGVAGDGEHVAALELGARDLDAAQVNDVLTAFQRKIVGDVNGRHQEAELLGEAFAQGLDARQQLAALLGVDHGDEPGPDLQHQLIQLKNGIHGIGGRQPRRAFAELPLRGCGIVGVLEQRLFHASGGVEQSPAEGEKGDFGQAGDEPKRAQNAAGDLEQTGAAEDLPAHIDAERILGGRARDHDAAGN